MTQNEEMKEEENLPLLWKEALLEIIELEKRKNEIINDLLFKYYVVDDK